MLHNEAVIPSDIKSSTKATGLSPYNSHTVLGTHTAFSSNTSSVMHHNPYVNEGINILVWTTFNLLFKQLITGIGIFFDGLLITKR